MFVAILILCGACFAAGYMVGGSGKHSHRPGTTHWRAITDDEEREENDKW